MKRPINRHYRGVCLLCCNLIVSCSILFLTKIKYFYITPTFFVHKSLFFILSPNKYCRSSKNGSRKIFLSFLCMQVSVGQEDGR